MAAVAAPFRPLNLIQGNCFMLWSFCSHNLKLNYFLLKGNIKDARN